MRKTLGGGMRQAGILAAAGIVALEEMVDRLAEDHTKACQLAQELAAIPAIEIDVTRVKTNILFFTLREDATLTPVQLSAALAQDDVLIGRASPKGQFRLLTHYWIRPAHVDFVVEQMRRLLQ